MTRYYVAFAFSLTVAIASLIASSQSVTLLY
jgi:hypothetical protein